MHDRLSLSGQVWAIPAMICMTCDVRPGPPLGSLARRDSTHKSIRFMTGLSQLIEALLKLAQLYHSETGWPLPHCGHNECLLSSLISGLPHGDPLVSQGDRHVFFIFLFVCFTRYLVFRIAVLPHRPGVVYYHLLLRRETRIPGVAPFSFRIGIWDLFVHRGQKSYTPTAFGKLWTTPGVRCMKHASS